MNVESHKYKLILGKPEPIGILKERLALMPKHFFSGNSFLDIGCNNGFFTLIADCDYIESIDPEKKHTDIVKTLSTGKVINVSFRDYRPIREFDRIFIGNTHHYIYKECGNWNWIKKLSAISNGLVLIEGPTGLDNKTADEILEGEIRDDFTEEKFMDKMNEYFILISKVSSPYSTRNRSIMLFESKKVQKIQLKDIPKGIPHRENEWTRLFSVNNKMIKITKQKTDDELIRIRIASKSPVSNGLLEEIYDGDQFVGWTEVFNGLHHKQEDNLDEILREHEDYLNSIGYIDFDTGSCNFHKNGKLFDKNQVFHISLIS